MKMKYFEQDIRVGYMEADSFPMGVGAAHKKITAAMPECEGRAYYGISFPVNGEIRYKAAATELEDGEAARAGCKEFAIRKGLYLGVYLKNWQADEFIVKNTFEQLLKDPRLDPGGYCLEEYLNDTDMICMVPLDREKVLLYDRKELADEVKHTFDALLLQVGRFSEESLNAIPFEGSWTAGQVTEHILKAAGRIPDHLTSEPGRLYKMQEEPLKNMFLDFSIRMNAPEFVLPLSPTHQRQVLLDQVYSTRQQHIEWIGKKDLHELCVAFEFKGFGFLTRYEWMKFILFHTQRHTRQLDHIYTISAQK